ncbi:hypothetical protein B0T09DRAFT_64235 [Sordaria sp. MPI-SDFR-AT-0083]|nr:hypothetical protein B0T09DRAFT_64235 [Sordaria sp. MPI-SDFR-AT-0083]
MAQPQLRRRTSLRDKLRVWQKPTSILDTVPDNEEERPRYVYQPKHAATDFSQLTITPPPSMLRECRPCISGSEASQISRPQTRQSRRAYRHPESANPPAEMRFRGHRRDMASASSQQERFKSSHLPSPPTWTTTRPAPLTDYELFLAQAEHEERPHQELLNSMETQLHDLVRPDPHQQYVTLAPTSLSAGSTAVAGTSRTTTGNKSRASRNSWAPSYATGGAMTEVTGLQQHKGTTGGKSFQGGSDPRGHTVMSNGVEASIHRSGTVRGISDDSHTRQPRALTLKRQASFAQRIAEYIRPPRPDVMDSCRNETTLKLTRSGSRAGLRRLVAVPIHHIETLAE